MGERVTVGLASKHVKRMVCGVKCAEIVSDFFAVIHVDIGSWLAALHGKP